MVQDASPPPARNQVRSAAAMVLLAATLWGLSGTVAQDLMQHLALPLSWVATARMSLAGVGLLALAGVRHGARALLAPWQTLGDSARLVLFATVGLFLVQYSYLAAIKIANAADATVIQYLGSGLVVLWMALSSRRPPPARHVAALLAALVGIGLLATNGSLAHLAMPGAALGWGLVSALTLAVYTIVPRPLLARHGTLPVLGWAMLVAAACAAVTLRPPAVPAPVGHPLAALLFAFVVVGGTIAPFALYLGSMRRLPASEAALLANAEPVAAALAALVWLHVRLGGWAAAGGLLVLLATSYLFRTSERAAPAADAAGRDGQSGAQRA